LNIINELISSEAFKIEAINGFNEHFSELRNIIEGVTLLKEITLKIKSLILSFGEKFSSVILETAARSIGLNTVLIKAEDILKVDLINETVEVNYYQTEKCTKQIINEALNAGLIPITQGFVCGDSAGNTRVLSRGGSDFSAAVFGAVLAAEEIEIWTDVSGVLSADPRVFPTAIPIDEMTFSQTAELSFYGAKVLHPDTVQPAIKANIPVRVLNTHQPEHRGTRITNKEISNTSAINSLVVKKDLKMISFENMTYEELVEIRKNIIDEITNYKIKTYYFGFSATNFKIAVEKDILLSYDAKAVCKDISIICISGVFKAQKEKLLSRIFNCFNKIEFEQLNNDYSIVFVIDNSQIESVSNNVHNLILELNNKS